MAPLFVVAMAFSAFAKTSRARPGLDCLEQPSPARLWRYSLRPQLAAIDGSRAAPVCPGTAARLTHSTGPRKGRTVGRADSWLRFSVANSVANPKEYLRPYG